MCELIKKLQKIQAELKAPKGQYNSFGKYNYRSCEDILEAVKPLLADQGCVLRLFDEPVCIGDWHYIKATAQIFDEEDEIGVTAYAREPAVKPGMSDSQITGATSSYARKYALNGLFCIDDTKDADTMDNRAEQLEKAAQAQGLPVSQEAESSPFPATLCKQCGQPIVDMKMKDGRILPAQIIVQKWGGLCAKCVKAGANERSTQK